jgi:hypothetical protein
MAGGSKGSAGGTDRKRDLERMEIGAGIVGAELITDALVADRLGGMPAMALGAAEAFATPKLFEIGERIALQHDANGQDKAISLGRSRTLERTRDHDRGLSITD